MSCSGGPAFMGRDWRCLEIPARAPARVEITVAQQLSKCVEINLMAAALCVRCKRSSVVWTLVPADSQPSQVFDRGICINSAAAVGIEVFHAQDQHSSGIACALICGEESARVAHVQVACWRWREPAPVSRRRRLIGTGHAEFQCSQLRRGRTPPSRFKSAVREGEQA